MSDRMGRFSTMQGSASSAVLNLFVTAVSVEIYFSARCPDVQPDALASHQGVCFIYLCELSKIIIPAYIFILNVEHFSSPR